MVEPGTLSHIGCSSCLLSIVHPADVGVQRQHAAAADQHDAHDQLQLVVGRQPAGCGPIEQAQHPPYSTHKHCGCWAHADQHNAHDQLQLVVRRQPAGRGQVKHAEHPPYTTDGPLWDKSDDSSRHDNHYD